MLVVRSNLQIKIRAHQLPEAEHSERGARRDGNDAAQEQSWNQDNTTQVLAEILGGGQLEAFRRLHAC